MKKEELTLLLLGLAAFLYCLARVVGLSMTHDESATVLEYASQPVWQVIANDPPRANNHLLNTLLIQFFGLFGNNKVLVRLPNLLAGGLFLFFSCRLILRMASGWWELLLAFALLVLNPYQLEFFALARGYGLSLGLMMGSLYFAHSFLYSRKLNALAGSAALAALACCSNLAMLTYFAALAIVFNALLLAPPREISWPHWRKANGILLSFALALFALLFGPVRALIREGELYYGGVRGLLPDTFTTMVHNYLGPEQYFGDNTREVFLLPVFALLLLAISRNLWEGARRRQFDGRILFTGLLVLMALGNVIQHELFGARYLINRTALLYFPLVALAVFYLFRGAPGWLKLALLLAIVLHFFQRANVTRVQEWWYERYTEEAFEHIVAQHPPDSTLRLGAFWIFTPTLSYYKQSRGYTHIVGPNLDYEPPKTKYFNYYYLSCSDTGKLHPDYLLSKSFGEYCIMKLPPGKKE